MTICAIHQPNFFPWAGYFDKIRHADIFIFLDEVAYPKSGSGSGSWCNRVKLLNGGKSAWYGLPVNRVSGEQLIKNVSFANKEHYLKKISKSLELNYSKAGSFKELLPLIKSLLNYPSDNLSDYNINAIIQLSQVLGFKTKFVRQSELTHHNQSTGLLIELVRQVDADAYLCGNGCAGYQEDFMFKEAGIELIYQSKHLAKNFVLDIPEVEEELSMLHLLIMYKDRFLGTDKKVILN